MKRFILSASALALLSGMALAPAQAAPYQHRHGGLTASERIAIGRSQHRVNVIKARARADGHVTFWERAKIRMAESRHNALVYRLRHN